MIAMQYKIVLPADYDMKSIRQRVAENGSKTDGFPDLFCKAYLIYESENHKTKEYAPLYLWKDSEGMNQFIFQGFYDNILHSFGWQNIAIGIPYLSNFKKDFASSRYVVEIEKEILPTQHMQTLNFSKMDDACTGAVLIYNPDKWHYAEYYFFKDVPVDSDGKCYEILHLSQE